MFLIYAIIGFTAFISYRAFEDRGIFHKLLFNAYAVTKEKQYYRVLSHMFIHSDWNHLIFNMLTFWFFASSALSNFSYYTSSGLLFFILLYITGGLAASLPALLKHKDNPSYNSVGASGAVSAVVFTSIFFNPWAKMMFIFFPIPIPGFIFGILYLVASSYMNKKSNDNIAHDAHIAGAVYGFIFPILVNPDLLDVFITQIMS